MPAFILWHATKFLPPFCCSVVKSCPSLCDPVDFSMPGFPLHHYLPEHAQTHVHWVSDTIQPSHPLSTPSPPDLSLSQHQGLFQWVSSVLPASTSVLPIQGWFPLILTGLFLLSKGLSRVFSSTTVWKNHFFGVQLSLWSNSPFHT